MTLTQQELLALAEAFASALEESNQTLVLISEDAARGQKERLPLIKAMADKTIANCAPAMERLKAIRDAYGKIE